MVDHCANCNCENQRKYFGLKKETYFKILLLFSLIFFIGMSIIVLKQIMRDCTSTWSDPHFAAFALLYSGFLIIYIVVLDVAIQPLENLQVYIPRLYRRTRGCMRTIWNRLVLPTWLDSRLRFSLRRAIGRTQPQQEIPISDNESNEEDRPPPLPPRNRNMIEEEETTMFQKLTSKVSQGASSSTATEDESVHVSFSLSHRPHCSKQSVPSVESSRRRRKKMLKREHFKDMMSKLTNLNVIHEESLDTQGTSDVKVQFSSLTQTSASDSETEQETSFIFKPHQPGAAEQDFGYVNVDESDERAPTRRDHGVQMQAHASSTGDKQKDPDQTSGSTSSTKKQLSTFQDFSTQSGLEFLNPTSSGRKRWFISAPISKFGTMCRFKDVPLSTLENPSQEQTFANVYSGSQGEVKESNIQCQTSASFIRFPESESQSRAFHVRSTEGNEKSLNQPPPSAELQYSLSQTQEQSSAVAFYGSQEQSRLCDIQKSQGNRDQAAANYIKLSQLENTLSVSDIRTEMKESSTKQTAIRDVQTSLQGQVSSVPGIQRMPTYQGQTSSAGLQTQGRISDIQRRRSSRKHTPIPIYRKSSESESDSEEERFNLQQPLQSCAQFSLAKSQLQTSGIGEVHEYSTQEIEMQKRTLQEETSTPWTSRTTKTLEKLRNLQQASEAVFLETTSQARHIEGSLELPISTDYARKRFRGKAEKATTQKRRDSLSIVSEIPFREWNMRTKRTEGPTESTSELSACSKEEIKDSSIQRQRIEASGEGYLPHSTLSRSDVTPTQTHVVNTPLNKTKMGEDQIRQRSSRDPSHLKETDKQNTQRKETILTFDMAAVGLVLSKDGAEGEIEADSSDQSFTYHQSMNVLDLSHIEVPLPQKDINPSIDTGKSQISEIPIRQSSIKTKRVEGSSESTSQLFACARGRPVTSNIQRQQIESSASGYLPHSTLIITEGTPTQQHVTTTPLKKVKECEDQIGQRSSTDTSDVKEKQETQRTETFFTFGMATGGQILNKDAPEDETEANSSEKLFVYGHSTNVFDLSHIEVPLLSKDIKPSKDKGESETSERLICQSSTRTKRPEGSAESSSQLSVWARGAPESFNIRSQEIEASEKGHLPHSALSISEGSPTQPHEATTLLKYRKEPQDLTDQRSSIDPLHLKETVKQETQRKENFLTLDLTTGGLVLSKDEAEDETEADSSHPSLMCDQPFDVLDLTHIEVPFPPPKDKASKDKDERQN